MGSTPANDDSPDMLLEFYSGDGTDTEGRTLDEILGWDDDALEFSHDFIQWIFPTDQPSAFNPDAPLVTARHMSEFVRRPALRANLLRSLRRMLAFYGLDLTASDSGVRVGLSASWETRKRGWLTPHNHNHLRLTRILISLRLLGLADHADALFKALEQIRRSETGGAISDKTFMFWQSAVRHR